MELIELQLSIKSINLLQKAGVWLLEDIIEKMNDDPSLISLVLAKISSSDFTEITEAIRKNTVKT